MVQWETQLQERSVPAWRDKYVNYGRLKRKLDQLKVDTKDKAPVYMAKALSQEENEGNEGHKDRQKGGSKRDVADEVDEAASQLLEDAEKKKEEFLEDVHDELHRVSAWYEETVTVMESRVRALMEKCEADGPACLQGIGAEASEEVAELHLEAAQLTVYVLLNVEALRKIVKKMDKQCKTSYQKEFVEKHLKRSPLATPGNTKEPFDGQRARQCRRKLEELMSPERLQELRSQALAADVGAGLSKLTLKRRRALVAILLAAAALPCAAYVLPDEPRAQRCVMLLIFIVSMWVLEAAPFESTALLVPPLAIILRVLPGTDKIAQAKAILKTVFSDSLYLVLSGFAISSVFSRCQLDSRAADVLQRLFGKKPFIFMLAVMFLGVGLSALLSNVTAPLLLVEVLKPLIRDLPTDSRYSRALLLGLAFSCNIGGMMTPISSPQNIASLALLKLRGGNITWTEWLMVSIPLCTVAVVMAWGLLLVHHHYDLSEEERTRNQRAGPHEIPPVIFDKQELTRGNYASLAAASTTLAIYACVPVSEFFGGTAMVALIFISLALATGMVSRQTFNSYNWHLMFLIGGGSALGFAVSESGLLSSLTDFAKQGLSGDPPVLVMQLVALLVAATTFVSHTVAALVLMPLVAELGAQAGVANLSVLVAALACSAACALPMTSFPNVNSLMAQDDNGKPWLSVKHFLRAGTPMTVATGLLLVSLGYWLAKQAVA